MIIAVLQARLSSTRLPGKVLLPILGQPMLAHQVARVQCSHAIDALVVATSDQPEDDAIAALCAQLGVACVRGPLDDVLARFILAVQTVLPADVPAEAVDVVRLTGDCPLSDPEVIDAVIALHREGHYDYTSNVAPATFPDGLDVEVVRWPVLQAAHQAARSASDREHVTPWVRRACAAGSWRQGNLTRDPDCSRLRWTVDEPADFELVSRIFAALWPGQPRFGMNEVLAVLALHPDWLALNAGLQRNAGYQQALAHEAASRSGPCQKAAFLDHESDAWCERNRLGLDEAAERRAWLHQQLTDCFPAGTRVLEIGCANGGHLAALQARFAITGAGIDPGQAAIAEGRARYPQLDLQVATADQLPHADGSFDVVWFGFCLYLVDRSLLWRCVAEADRVLREGGRLIITDFDPGFPRARPYVHSPGVWSWKMDYPALWLANPAYHCAQRVSYSHAGPGFEPQADERVATTVLVKQSPAVYRGYEPAANGVAA